MNTTNARTNAQDRCLADTPARIQSLLAVAECARLEGDIQALVSAQDALRRAEAAMSQIAASANDNVDRGMLTCEGPNGCTEGPLTAPSMITRRR